MHDLRPLLMTLLAQALAGCGGPWPDEGGDWQTARCEGGVFKPVADLQTDTPWDYLAFTSYGVDGPGETFDEAGERCSGADDVDACLAVADGVEGATFQNHALTTAGNIVRSWVGADDTAELLGPIDTPSEALLMAFSQGDRLVCDNLDETAVRAVEDGWEVVSTSYRSICAPIVRIRTLRSVSRDGALEILEEDVLERSSACIGRRPAGLGPARCADGPAVARWLAQAARLEAASVQAFHDLADALQALGAPDDLVADARSFAEDEVRHAEAVGRLAALRGASALSVEVAPAAAPDALRLALDNAVEGCVRETWGALLGALQAATAADAGVATAMDGIAHDEARHAGLAWRIADWLEPRLPPADRAAVAAARSDAARALREELRIALPADVARPLGLPDPALADRLWRGLDAALWAA